MAEAVVNIVGGDDLPVDDTLPYVLGIDVQGRTRRRQTSTISSAIASLVEGTGVDINITNPANPVINTTTLAGSTILGTSQQISVSDGDGRDVGGAIVDITLSLASEAIPYGKMAMPIPVGAMRTRATTGAAVGSIETTTNKNNYTTLDFDASTQEYAQFLIPMPPSWNEGTVTYRAIWTHGSTTTNFSVVWSLAGVAMSNDDTGDVAFGTAVNVTDVGGTTNDIYISDESTAITIAGTPAEGDLVMFEVARVAANGSDTLAVDAKLIAVVLYLTTTKGNDA